MMTKALLISTLAIALVAAQEVTTPAPSEDLACNGKLDLAFVFDSSSSIGDDNFQLVREYAASVVSGLNISLSATRVGAVRFTSWAQVSFSLNRYDTADEVREGIEDVQYFGKGTHIAGALLVTANQLLQKYNGWRQGNVSTVVLVITDGMSQQAAQIPMASLALKTKATRVLAIGIGNVNETELQIVASSPSSDNVILLDTFSELSEASHIEETLTKICEAVDDVNECLVDKGGCAEICVNTYSNYFCRCKPGYNLVGGSSNCADIDECAVNNGGCSDTCQNLPGSYECQCPAGMILVENRRTRMKTQCVEDSCLNNNECEQICQNVIYGDFLCSCRSGFILNSDGRTCTDINECAVNNGNCQYNCTNTPGSYMCGCQDGFGLRPDRTTCGLLCYTCSNAINNDQCQDLTVCAPNELSCQTTTRTENSVTYIDKQCKQTEACVNNFIQNPRTAWSPTQCNDVGHLSVCRCCCHEGSCNKPGDCTLSDAIDIICPDPHSVYTVEPPINLDCSQKSNTTEYTVGDTCQVGCPTGFGPDNGVTELYCTQEPRTTNGIWSGEIGVCVDINECATSNGGCSDICTNTNGSFTCSCFEATPCSDQASDVFFILDSSSSVGAANFKMMTTFVGDFVERLNVGQDPGQIRVGAMTFNKGQIQRINLNECTSPTECKDKFDAIDYSGEGTRTALAIDFTLNNGLKPIDGRRLNLPLSVIIITDGRTQRPLALPTAAARLNREAHIVFVIGVTHRVNEHELDIMAGGNSANYRILSNFTNLDSMLYTLIEDRICTQPTRVQSLTSDGLKCDLDECEVDNGGCSNTCNNTVGSFFCSCPEGQALSPNGRTCVINLCLIDNGGCAKGCTPISNTTRRCFCPTGELLMQETECVDHNECLDENGGCSHECLNLDPGHVCTCPEGFVLQSNRETCERDSCSSNPCSQVCTNIAGNRYECSCFPGYLLNDDLHNCTDIDECAVQNGGCEITCVNTPGSYVCECPEGQALRADGRTCGISCFTCRNVASDDQCTQEVACSPGQDTCFTTVRVNNNVTRITKGCQQTEACINNMLQNNQRAGEGPTQCNNHKLSSKCECCCNDILCNRESGPCNYQLPTCPQSNIEFISYTGTTNNSTVVAGGSAYVNCPQGFEFVMGSGLEEIDCEYNFVNMTAGWEFPLSDLGSCQDINECFNSTGGCVAPATCQNLPGSYECVCPNGTYELIDDFICEIDECSVDNGGCSHNCTNTIGSFFCGCPPRLSLLDDGLTCNINECEEANGGCNQICKNTRDGYECSCSPGYQLTADGVSCVDINECATQNGGCSQNCTNRVPGFECSCRAGYDLQSDGFTCQEDPCYTENGGCEHICKAAEGVAVCSCRPGYVVLADGSCEDVNECLTLTPSCQYNCTNTDGSFYCECPEGQGLRPDGRTCGRACHSCNGALTNEECNSQPIQVCPADADACENEVRENNNVKAIFKRCKQAMACNNNHFQNDQRAASPTQCNNNENNNVCRCCCIGHLCNVDEKPCVTEAPACSIDRADVVVVADSSSSVKFDNFQLMKEFIMVLFNSFKLGDDQVHAALLRYNAQVELQFNLASVNNQQEVDEAVADMLYNGSGTNTGAAIQYVLDEIDQVANGRRPDVPLIVVVITDGKSNDNVTGPSIALRAAGALTFAVGVLKARPEELNMISGDPSRTFITSNFTGLAATVLDDLQEAVCADVDECKIGNGGCSDECVNVKDSYICRCPSDKTLSADMRTCFISRPNEPVENNVDECAENKGGCQYQCNNIPGGFECSCQEGFEIADDGKNCVEIDYCTNVTCSSGLCANVPGGFFCYCVGNEMISSDNQTCVARPGVADCPSGWMAYGHSCVLATESKSSYTDADADCKRLSVNARLITVNDALTLNVLKNRFQGPYWIGLNDRDEEGVWINSDGSVFSLNAGWGTNQPGSGDCGYMNGGSIFSSGCGRRRLAICQIPRAIGLPIFTRVWNYGANGEIYPPTGTNAIRVEFPHAVTRLSPWHVSETETVTESEYILKQKEYDTGGDGKIGFTVIFTKTTQFPARNIVIEPYVN